MSVVTVGTMKHASQFCLAPIRSQLPTYLHSFFPVWIPLPCPTNSIKALLVRWKKRHLAVVKVMKALREVRLEKFALYMHETGA